MVVKVRNAICPPPQQFFFYYKRGQRCRPILKEHSLCIAEKAAYCIKWDVRPDPVSSWPFFGQTRIPYRLRIDLTTNKNYLLLNFRCRKVLYGRSLSKNSLMEIFLNRFICTEMNALALLHINATFWQISSRRFFLERRILFPGSLDKKGGRRCHLFPNRCHLLPPFCVWFAIDQKVEEDATFCVLKDVTRFPLFLSNKPGTGLTNLSPKLWIPNPGFNPGFTTPFI
jgi:hypothetical protein